MQISTQPLNHTIEGQVFAILFQVLKDLLSDVELKMVAKRLAIAIYLDKGRSYENIRQTLKVSSATIAAVQEKMSNPGIKLALQKIKTDDWAQDWTDKLTSVFRQLVQ